MYKLVCISYILLSFHAGISESCLQHIEWAEVLPSSAADDCHSRDQSPRVPCGKVTVTPNITLSSCGVVEKPPKKGEKTTPRPVVTARPTQTIVTNGSSM